jgi:hypothetical protein
MTENVASSRSSVQSQPIAAAARGRWLRLLMLAVIFLSGLVAGVGVTLLAVRQGVLYGIHHPEEMPARVATRLRRPLNLSDQQAERIEAIIQQRQTHLQEIRRRFQPEVEAELEQVYAEIRELLDDQQRERWEQIYTHLRQTWIPPLPKPARMPGRSD